MHDRWEIARRVCDELTSNDVQLRAVLLVGSVALNRHSRDSDVDIVVFTEGSTDPQILGLVQEGIRVVIERQAVGQFNQVPLRPVLDLRALRDAARFARGHVLYTRWPLLERLRLSWMNAVLDPAEAVELFTMASENLSNRPVAPPPRLGERIWRLQGAAAALATLALSVVPCRFQKPKWVMRDLREWCQERYVSPLTLAYVGAGDLNREVAQGVLNDVWTRLQLGRRLANLPELAPNVPRDPALSYVFRTYDDASSLVNDGDFQGAIYTAVFSLRLMDARLRRRRTVTGYARREWMIDSVDYLGRRLSWTRHIAEQANTQMLAMLDRLKVDYR